MSKREIVNDRQRAVVNLLIDIEKGAQSAFSIVKYLEGLSDNEPLEINGHEYKTGYDIERFSVAYIVFLVEHYIPQIKHSGSIIASLALTNEYRPYKRIKDRMRVYKSKFCQGKMTFGRKYSNGDQPFKTTEESLESQRNDKYILLASRICDALGNQGKLGFLEVVQTDLDRLLSAIDFDETTPLLANSDNNKEPVLSVKTISNSDNSEITQSKTRQVSHSQIRGKSDDGKEQPKLKSPIKYTLTSQKKKKEQKKRKTIKKRINRIFEKSVIGFIIAIISIFVSYIDQICFKDNRSTGLTHSDYSIETASLPAPTDLLREIDRVIEKMENKNAQWEQLEENANLGDMQSQFGLALLYLRDEDYSNVETWLLKAVEQGHTTAKAFLGLLYSAYIDWKLDNDLAYSYARDSAESGDGYGSYLYARFNYDGIGTEINYSEAEIYFENAISKGIMAAANDLGLMYVSRQVDDLNERESYQKAAEYYRLCYDDVVEAKHNIACMLQRGIGVEKDSNLAIQLFESAAKDDEYIPSMKALACIYFSGDGVIKKDMQKSGDWFKEAADLGDPESQFALGNFYLGGYYSTEPTREGDITLGITFLEDAAKNGLPQAQLILGIFYCEGINVKIDLSKGFSWLLEASEDDGEVGVQASEYLRKLMTSDELWIDDNHYLKIITPSPSPII